MGMPEIFISFATSAVSAVTRSARGTLALVVADGTAGGEACAVYRDLTEVPEKKFTAENYRLLKLAFLAAPSRAAVLRAAEDPAQTFAALEKLQFDWLAAPGLDNDRVVSWIKARRAQGRGVKAVVAGAAGPDCEGIVNLRAEGLVLTDGPVEAGDYAARVAVLLAALPEVADPDAAVEAGGLIVVPGSGGGYRLGRAVNSLTTLTVDHGAAFQKIKIVEGVDLIRRDIAGAFESGYIGKVLNDNDNKLLLVAAINAYFAGLAGDVLDRTAENVCRVSLKGQRSYLQGRGVDTANMSDAQILRANTGDQVFLEAELTFCDAMEDLSLAISM